MKKILIMTAFALGSLAAAQTSTPSMPDTTTPSMPMDTTTPSVPTDTTTDTTTPSVPTDTTTTDTTTPSLPGSTSTGTTTTTTTTSAPVAQMLTPDAYFARAQEFATQADVAYPVPFYDRTLWKAAVDSAYLASMGNVSNRDYTSYLGQLYTKTQWWINGYRVWQQLGNLTDTEKDWAALTAAKLAYIALNRGDRTTAMTYVQQGMAWKSTPSLQGLMQRLQ